MKIGRMKEPREKFFFLAAALLSALTVLLSALTVRAQPLPKEIRLGAGSSTTFSVSERIARIQTIDPAVLDVLSVGRVSVTVVGVKAGQTELFITLASGRRHRVRVEVVQSKDADLVRQVRAYIGAGSNLVVRLVGRWIVVEGRAATLDQMRRVERVSRLLVGRVRNLAALHPGAVKELDGILTRAGIRMVRARLLIGPAEKAKEGRARKGGPEAADPPRSARAGRFVRAASGRASPHPASRASRRASRRQASRSGQPRR